VDGVNADTVWTWNAIGKRQGAWGLAGDAAESTRGFLLNHTIGDLLPPDAAGRRYANSDPVTGQAAWFDLRVRIVPCEPYEAGFTEPQFEPPRALPHLSPAPVARLDFGAGFRHQREKKVRR
jgi:sulfite dehydrogenase (quinone) subunit SoeA